MQQTHNLLADTANRHFLSIGDLDMDIIYKLMDRAKHFHALFRQDKKNELLLQGRTVMNLFYEPSTRTRVSFEVAAKRLGADVINFDAGGSSETKGESLKDTALTLNAMNPDAIVIRHKQPEPMHVFVENVDCPVINAGDGAGEHPTQALLDAFTIFQAKGKIEGLTIAICGDILHSRVAHSNMKLLPKLGARVHVAGPPILLPEKRDACGVRYFENIQDAIKDADIVMMLRIQRERMTGDFAISEKDYFHTYGLDQAKLALARPDAFVMDPGPIIRGVQIDSAIADGPRSLIIAQVENGVAMRAAILEMMILGRTKQ